MAGIFSGEQSNIFEQQANEGFLIIAADKRHEKHADYLLQLISQDKDMPIKAAIWNGKIYKDTKAKLTQKNYIIFIGDDNWIENETGTISNKYNKYGMKYGWIGTRARLYVDPSFLFINPATYKNFINYAYGIKHNKLGMHGTSSDNEIINVLDDIKRGINDWLYTRELQYKCLVSVFYVEAFKHFIDKA